MFTLKESCMISVEVANRTNAALLAAISKNAFDTDVLVGGKSIGGPPNYDSVKWHKKMIDQGNLSSITLEGEIIGGIITFHDKSDKQIMYVGRIFIDPKYHKKGYGVEAMAIIEKANSSIKYWRLETPDWNIRTNSFYKKIGYIEMERKGHSVFFQKSVGL